MFHLQIPVGILRDWVNLMAINNSKCFFCPYVGGSCDKSSSVRYINIAAIIFVQNENILRLVYDKEIQRTLNRK